MDVFGASNRLHEPRGMGMHVCVCVCVCVRESDLMLYGCDAQTGTHKLEHTHTHTQIRGPLGFMLRFPPARLNTQKKTHDHS